MWNDEIAAFSRRRRASAALLVLVLLALLGGCTSEADHPSLKGARLPPLLQAHRFSYFGNLPGGYTLSPDGHKVAWFGPYLWRRALHVRDNTTGGVRRFRVGGEVRWTPDSRYLLWTADATGSENHHVFMIDTGDPAGEPVDLTPWPGVRAGIQQLTGPAPGEMLLYHNRRDARVFDLYRVELATRRAELVARNPGDATAPITTADGQFRGWQKSREAQRRAQEQPAPLAARKARLHAQRADTYRPLGTNADGSVAWALSDRGRRRIALVAAEPVLGWERVLFEDPVADVSQVAMSRRTHAPMLAASLAGYPRIAFLDKRLERDLQGLLKGLEGKPFGLDLVSADVREQRLVVSIYTNAQRGYYLLDRSAGTHVRLAETYAPDFADALVPTRPVVIRSRDGLDLHGYLTLPRGVAPKRLPMVLDVHGGPWMRTAWGDPAASDDATYAQFLANRGYAVLQVDFRGSSGYGRAFMDAGIGEFAGRMQDDLLDAVRWAVDGGIADPDRVAIMGWSYGGYAALVGMTMTPHAYACGISLSGPTDLASLIESFPPYWSVDLSRWHDFVGDPEIPEDRREMTDKSPLAHAGAVERPVLIVHGARDVRVRVTQSDRMVAALRRAGKDVDYLRIPDMGHGNSWWPHRLVILRRTERFLHRCLGGRASRFDWFDPVEWAWLRWSRWQERRGQQAGGQ